MAPLWNNFVEKGDISSAAGRRTLICLIVLFISFESSSSDEVSIYDTSVLEELKWEPKVKDYRIGWHEASYNSDSGITSRVVAVCNLDIRDLSNWISTPSLEIPSKVLRIYVNIVFTVKKCEGYPNPEQLQQCKEVFKLAYEQSGLTVPDWNKFVIVDTIAATNLISLAPSLKTTVNNETKSIGFASLSPSKPFRSVRLGFLDEGSCTSLLSVRVFYLVCPKVVVSFVNFPETTAGPELTSLVETVGRCVDNSVPVISSENGKVQEIRRLCQADGKWFRMESDGCQCKAGYQPNTSAHIDSCIECPPSFYKSTPGNSNCLYCPQNSISSSPGSSSCSCIPGFERLEPVSSSQPCYKTVGPIRNLTVTNVSESSVMLSWLHPSDMTPLSEPSTSSGLPPSLVYYVSCVVCDTSPYVRYLPKRSGQFTSITITGLSPSTAYTVSVLLRNETNRKDYNSSLAFSTFSTLSSPAGSAGGQTGSPSPPIRVHVLGIIEDSVQLVWETSLSLRSFEIVVFYDVNKEYRRLHVYDFRNVSIDHLGPGQTYSFVIRGETVNGWTAFSDPVYAKIGDSKQVVPVNLPQGGENSGIVGAAVGGTIGGLALLLSLVLIVLILYYRRFRNPNKCMNSQSDCDILKYVNASIKAAPHIPSNTPSDTTLRSGESFHIYADPTSFEHDTTLTSLKSLELSPSYVAVRSVLNKTWAGEIALGVLISPDSRPDRLVTIETIKRDAVLRGRRADVKVGAGVLKRLDHPNIVKVEGFVARPLMIVVEFMQNGCLKDFLTKNSKSSSLSFIQLVRMLRDAADGMHHLSERGLIHQNLTTESILVSSNLTCKISSLHSVTTVESTIDLKSGSFTTNIPPTLIRWTAPEVLFNARTSIGSDVWSFGMVMWQTLSRGEDPYSGWTDEEVVRAVSNSMCLSNPAADCPEAIYQLMMQCWRLQRDARPSFSYIIQLLTSYCEGTPITVAQTPHTAQDKLNLGITVDPESSQNLVEPRTLLVCNGAFSPSDRSTADSHPYLSMYWDLLQSKGYNSIDKILMLEDPGLLTNIGVVSPTHQFFLLNEIQKLRHRDSGLADFGRASAVPVNCIQSVGTQNTRRNRPHSQQINYQHFNNIEQFQNDMSLQQQQQQPQQTSSPPTQGAPSEFSSRQNLLLATSHLNLNNDNNLSAFSNPPNGPKIVNPHYTGYNSFTAKGHKGPNNGPLDKGQKYRMGISALTSQKNSGENFFV